MPDQLAYLILCHTDFARVGRLIDALTAPGVQFYVHVDVKAPWNEEHARFRAEYPLRKDVQFIECRPVSWGGFSMVDASLRLLERAYRNPRVGYFRLLSGQDYPVCDNETIYRRHFENTGKNYLLAEPADSAPPGRRAWDRVRYFYLSDWIESNFHSRNFHYAKKIQDFLGIRRRLPAPLEQLWIGGQWWSLHRDFVGWLLPFLKAEPRIRRFFQWCTLTDEIFFQTLLMNSPFASTLENEAFLYEQWEPQQGHPRALVENDAQRILGSGKLYCRKVGVDGDPLRDLLDQARAPRLRVKQR